MKYLLIILALLSLSLAIRAQDSSKTALQIGDKVPNVTITNILNYKNKDGKLANTAKISDFEGKLLILDFWATWCSSCIINFSKVDSLQNKFSKNVQFILVNTKSTGDKIQKIQQLLNDKNRFDGRVIKMPCVVLDTLLDQMFVHKMIPHYAWIRDGRLVATTSAAEINETNIQKVLQNKDAKLAVKQDIMDFNPYKPLFVDGNGGAENIILRSQISGEIPGLSGVTNITKDKSGLVTLYRRINTSKLNLYKWAYKATYLGNNRVFYKDDTLNVIQRGIKDPYIYCYEIVCPPSTNDRVRERLKFDIKQFFNLKGSIKMKTIKCYVLKKMPDTKNDLEPFEGTLNNGNSSELVSLLNEIMPNPALDETNSSIPIGLKFPADLSDIEKLVVVLKKQGLALTIENRFIEVFVLDPTGYE